MVILVNAPNFPRDMDKLSLMGKRKKSSRFPQYLQSAILEGAKANPCESKGILLRFEKIFFNTKKQNMMCVN